MEQSIDFTQEPAIDPKANVTDDCDKRKSARVGGAPDPPQLLGRGHCVKPMTQQMKESLERCLENIVAYSIEVEIDYYLSQHRNEYNEQDKMDDPIAYKALSNPDILYYHQAM